MVDEVFAVAAVGAALADAWVVVGEAAFADDGVLDASGGNKHGQHRAGRVDDDAAPPADDPFARVSALFASGDVGRGLHALCVDHEAGRTCVAALFLTDRRGSPGVAVSRSQNGWREASGLLTCAGRVPDG